MHKNATQQGWRTDAANSVSAALPHPDSYVGSHSTDSTPRSFTLLFIQKNQTSSKQGQIYGEM